jgi:NAD(P)-dependent dehydrogenase (short-subunit alcohol dehydrogenase family)
VKRFFIRQKAISETSIKDVEFIQLDVTDVKSIQSAAQSIEKKNGKLDLLINNAGKNILTIDI